jgi:hypothetical protein
LDLTSFAGTLVASAIGALFAGLLGLRLGMAKVRRERAFAARSKWYEEITQTLYSMAYLWESQAKLELRYRQLGITKEEGLEILRDRINLVTKLIQEGSLYSSREAVRALVLLGEVLTEIGFHGGRPDSQPDMGIVELYRCSAGFSQAIANRMAAEYREYIGLEQLDGQNYKHFDKALLQLRRQGKASTVRELVHMFREMHWIEQADEQRDAPSDGDQISLEWTDDAGGTWVPFYDGPPVGIRINEQSEETRRRKWRTLYQPWKLKSDKEWFSEMTKERG